MDIKKFSKDIETRLVAILNEKQLQEFRVAVMGKKGTLTLELRSLGSISKDKLLNRGKELNELRERVEGRMAELQKVFKTHSVESTIKKDRIDVTEPGRKYVVGSSHPLSTVLDDIISIFAQCGFDCAEGPEIETDHYNFAALNFPEDHPARDAQDTFYLNINDTGGKPFILRTHTSPVQIHLMQTIKPPIRALMPGRVYRHEAVDASHSCVFHQVEGLSVDTHITFADLKGVLALFVKRMYGKDIPLRFRPSFFPFTEPSAEIDIQCIFCKGTGCGVCKKKGWLEMMGAGMVHPNVFRAVGYDPDALTGFAFGMGVERIAMLRYGISDMRLFYENDMRFLSQF